MKKESIGLVKKFNKMLQKSPSELFGQLCIYMCVCVYVCVCVCVYSRN